MKLVIFHYHILPGGVTDVIKQALLAFDRHWHELTKVELLVGREAGTAAVKTFARNQTYLNFSIFYYPELDYKNQVSVDSKEVEKFAQSLYRTHGGENVLWWVHNHSLGKSLFYTKTILTIAQKTQQSMLLQMHDFAEEGRPTNLKLLSSVRKELYPHADNIHYAFINQRDLKFWQEAVGKESQSYYLGNPSPKNNVSLLSLKERSELKQKLYEIYASSGIKEGHPIWLYPVRTIRRKNVLEMAFLNQLQEKPANYVVTLGANSLPEKKYAKEVESLFSDGSIQGIFNIGMSIEEDLGCVFTRLFELSDLIVSPSLKEGFGYLFLSALEYQKPVLARELPVLKDFDVLYKEYPHYFYKKVSLPISTGMKNDIMAKYLEKGYSDEVLESLFHPLILEQALATTKLQEDYRWQVDFSVLPLEWQATMLRKLKENTFFREKSIELNTELLKKIKNLSSPSIQDDPRADIESKWGGYAFVERFKELIREPMGQIEDEESISERLEKLFDKYQEFNFLLLDET